MKHKLKIFFPVLVVSFFATALNVFPAEKHECNFCHITSDKTDIMQLKASLAELCIECHSDRKSQDEHRVGVVSPVKGDELPLSKDGRITCITCHDPHEKSGYPMLLRVNPSDLCLRCHFR